MPTTGRGTVSGFRDASTVKFCMVVTPVSSSESDSHDASESEPPCVCAASGGFNSARSTAAIPPTAYDLHGEVAPRPSCPRFGESALHGPSPWAAVFGARRSTTRAL